MALVLLVACGFLLSDLLATEGSGAYVKTTTLPTALVLVLIILSLVLLGGSLLRPAEQGPPVGQVRAGLLRVVAMLGWTAGFIAALPWFGYLMSSMVFLIGANLLYGNRKPIGMILVAVAVPLGLLLFFEKFMIVLLPSSRLIG